GYAEARSGARPAPRAGADPRPALRPRRRGPARDHRSRPEQRARARLLPLGPTALAARAQPGASERVGRARQEADAGARVRRLRLLRPRALVTRGEEGR